MSSNLIKFPLCSIALAVVQLIALQQNLAARTTRVPDPSESQQPTQEDKFRASPTFFEARNDNARCSAIGLWSSSLEYRASQDYSLTTIPSPVEMKRIPIICSNTELCFFETFLAKEGLIFRQKSRSRLESQLRNARRSPGFRPSSMQSITLRGRRNLMRLNDRH